MVAAGACDNKGFARRPHEFVGWELGGRMWGFLHVWGVVGMGTGKGMGVRMGVGMGVGMDVGAWYK